MRRPFAVLLVLCAAAGAASAACQEHFPTAAGTDAGPTEGGAAPLEASPPGIVAPEARRSASSSPVVFDPVRGGVWTANGDVGSISYVDVDARTVVRELAIPGDVPADVRSVALSPDGAYVAAVDRAGAAVTLVDAQRAVAGDGGAVLRSIRLGTHPRACVWDAANPRWLYVAVEDDGAVAVVDRTLGSVATTIPVGALPAGLAVSAQRRELYVTHRIDARVTVVDLRERAAAADVAIADEPRVDPAKPNGKPFGFESIGITADGRRAWVPHELLAPTHPFAFDQTLFPAISVVDLETRREAVTDPNAPNVDGRKNLFDAIDILDATGQPAVFSQFCAVALHPNGLVGWALACASEDLVTFDVQGGVATDAFRNLDPKNDHPVGLALDDTGQRVFVVYDQSHTLDTFDTANGSLVQHTRLYGSSIPLVAKDPVDPDLRQGLTLFYRANSSKGDLATTGNDWMSCGGCHLDGFTSANAALFRSLRPADPRTDATIGHVGLADLFSTAPSVAQPSTAPGFNPHDVLVALEDQGGLAPDRTGTHLDGQVDPASPPDAAKTMARQLARVIARDLPLGPSWLLPQGGAPNLAWDAQFCGGCHPDEYAEWRKSLHAHAAEDPFVLYGVGVEVALEGPQYARLCAGCHDPASARSGDTSFQAKRGVTCLGCHDVTRQIRAGGNADLEAQPHDWTTDHKAWGLASLEKLRQPELCGGCHEQFVPATGLVAIGTLDEYHASQYAGTAACVDCHMPKDAGGKADHRAAGGNVLMGEKFGDDALVAAQRRNLASVVVLSPVRSAGGVSVTVANRGAGHGFPTGVTDIREPWVEVQAKDAQGDVLARFGGPGADGSLATGAARLGIDVAAPDGTLLYEHQLSAAARLPFDVRVPAGGAQTLFVPLPAALPAGTASLDAVLYYRNVRTAYYRAATAATDAPPDVEVARAPVP